MRDGAWNGKEIEILNKHLFMSAKPVVYIINIGREEYIRMQNKWLPKIAEWIKANGGGPMIPYSAEYETEVLANAGSPERAARDEAAAALGKPTQVHKLINVGYRTL